MKFVVGENGRNLEKNLPRPRFVHLETHMVEPRRELGTPAVGGERLTACATRPPNIIIIIIIILLAIWKEFTFQTQYNEMGSELSTDWYY